MSKLRLEALMTIQTVAAKRIAHTQIARILGVSEGGNVHLGGGHRNRCSPILGGGAMAYAGRARGSDPWHSLRHSRAAATLLACLTLGASFCVVAATLDRVRA